MALCEDIWQNRKHFEATRLQIHLTKKVNGSFLNIQLTSLTLKGSHKPNSVLASDSPNPPPGDIQPHDTLKLSTTFYVLFVLLLQEEKRLNV